MNGPALNNGRGIGHEIDIAETVVPLQVFGEVPEVFELIEVIDFSFPLQFEFVQVGRAFG